MLVGSTVLLFIFRDEAASLGWGSVLMHGRGAAQLQSIASGPSPAAWWSPFPWLRPSSTLLSFLHCFYSFRLSLPAEQAWVPVSSASPLSPSLVVRHLTGPRIPPNLEFQRKISCSSVINPFLLSMARDSRAFLLQNFSGLGNRALTRYRSLSHSL